jgi:hypothetical protein
LAAEVDFEGRAVEADDAFDVRERDDHGAVDASEDGGREQVLPGFHGAADEEFFAGGEDDLGVIFGGGNGADVAEADEAGVGAVEFEEELVVEARGGARGRR